LARLTSQDQKPCTRTSGRHLPFYISLAVPFYDPIMLRYCIDALVPPVPVLSLTLFLAALVESLFFCLSSCSLAYFTACVFYNSSPLSRSTRSKGVPARRESRTGNRVSREQESER
jgi:hypothetical protein